MYSAVSRDKEFMKHVLREVVRISVAIAILPLFWPVAGVTVVLLLSVRYVIQKVLNLLHGKGVYTLVSGGSDGVFGHKVRGNSALIHTFTVLKGEPDLKSIRERYTNRLFAYNDPTSGRENIYDKFKWCLVTKLGFHCWHDVSSTFDVSRHVRYLDSIRPNEVYTEDKLMTLLGKLMSHDLNGRTDSHGHLMPQWDNLIIPNYRLPHESHDTRPSHFVSVYRVHHSYADGASFAILMDSVLADRPLQYCVDPLKPFPGMTFWKQSWINFKALTIGPLDFLLTLKSSILDDSIFILRKYSTQKFVDWSKPISLSLLKEIKAESGASLSTILISSCTGALSNLHELLGVRRNEPLKIPEKISVGNMVVMLPYPNREMQNHFTTFSVPYPFEEENMIRRLRATDAVGRSYLTSSEPWFHFYVMRFSSICPKALQDILLELPAAPVVFSNVPGLKASFQLFDNHLLVDVGAWLPLFKAYGMAISTYSYCNQLRICITGDSKLFENQAQLKSFIKDIEEGIYDLAKYYGVAHRRAADDIPVFSFRDKYNEIRRLSATRLIANG